MGLDKRGLCVKRCTDGQYAALESHLRPSHEKVSYNGCGDCYENCNTCLSWTKNSCLTCNLGFTLIKASGPWEMYNNPETGICVPVAPKGYYYKDPSDTRVYQCPLGCLDCKTWDDCLECDENYFLEFQKCHIIPIAQDSGMTAETYLGSAADDAPA